MTTKSKLNPKAMFRVYAIVPVVAIFLIVLACVNGQKKQNAVITIEPVGTDVLYLGALNPVRIEASGYDLSELEVSIDNGNILGSDGIYEASPDKLDTATVIVSYKGKEIQRAVFPVIHIPDPQVTIAGKTEGPISISELKNAKGLEVEVLPDGDIEFMVRSFALCATVVGEDTVRQEYSATGSYSENQLDLINSLTVNQELRIEGIVIQGLDGQRRKCPAMVFTINDI